MMPMKTPMSTTWMPRTTPWPVPYRPPVGSMSMPLLVSQALLAYRKTRKVEAAMTAASPARLLARAQVRPMQKMRPRLPTTPELTQV